MAILVPSNSRNRFTLLLLVQARSGLVFDAGPVSGGERSGSDRETGRTKEKLYNEAKQRGIRGRASMTKEQPRKAIDAKKCGPPIRTGVPTLPGSGNVGRW